MNTPCVVAFPGQGSQRPGACEQFITEESWDLVGEIDDAVETDIPYLLLTAGALELKQTVASQLFVFAVGLLCHHAISGRIGTPVCLVGHSVGEITALVASGSLGVASGARLIEARAHAMRDACTIAPGGMAALRTTTSGASRLIEDIEDIWIAAENAPRETVVGGTLRGLSIVEQRAARERVPSSRLAVDGAFHTPLMASAIEPFRSALDDVQFRHASVPVLSTVDGQVHVNGGGWEQRLLRQLTAPVRWAGAMGSVAAMGAAYLIDAGSGGRLARLARWVDSGLVAIDAERIGAELPSGATRP